MYGEGAETLVTVSRQPSFGGGVIRLQLVVMKQRFMHVEYMRAHVVNTRYLFEYYRWSAVGVSYDGGRCHGD